jgi:uncharacterized protein (TIGR03435 family)
MICSWRWFIHPDTAISKNRNGSSTLCVFKTHCRDRRAAVAKYRIFMQIQFSDHTNEENHLEGDNKRLKATDFRMDGLARILSAGGRLVVDKTGLTGGYDFELHWAMDDDSSSDQPSIYTAVQEQLGLKLESGKIPIQVVIIDRAEKPNQN